MVAFVEREGGITIDEDYLHMKFMNQIEHFQKFREEDFKLLGKMSGTIK